MDQVKSGINLRKIKNEKIGILGGSFDPPHIGHIKISLEAKKKFNINTIIWAITNKNPFKKKYENSLNKRIFLSKKIIQKRKFIKIRYYEKKLRSNKTINLIKFLKKRYFNSQLFFIIGADNLIKFHKWYKWRNICENCKILVFDRSGYKQKSLKSVAYKKFGKKTFDFVTFKKVNISSSKLRDF